MKILVIEWSKLSQKAYKTRHDLVVKFIHWKLCKRLKFNHINKWYSHKEKSLLENDTHKILCDFVLQTSHLIPNRRPNQEN